MNKDGVSLSMMKKINWIIGVLSRPVVDYSCFGNFGEFYLYMSGECQLKFVKIIISIMSSLFKNNWLPILTY